VDTPNPALAAFLELFVKLLADGTFLPVAAGLVVALTAIFKRFLPDNISSAVLALVFQVIVWIAYVVAVQLGYGSQFDTWISTITTIVVAIAGLVGSSFLATRAYVYASDREVPLFGYSRASRRLAQKAKMLAETLPNAELIQLIDERIMAAMQLG